MPTPTDHVSENRRYWDAMASDWVAAGERAWTRSEPSWGIWSVPESELKLLPEDMNGMHAVELGCGTAYVSAWMARRGARVTAIDNSEQQLATARRLATEHGLNLTLVHGNAEATPFGPGRFDFAISEYGAAIWCDPYKWLPEAYRMLKPGGRLVFLGNHPLIHMCSTPDGGSIDESLHNPYFGMHVLDWTQAEIDPGGIEFNLPISKWFELFNNLGFIVEDYLEPRPTAEVTDTRFMQRADWARNWPGEQVWKLRKPA